MATLPDVDWSGWLNSNFNELQAGSNRTPSATQAEPSPSPSGSGLSMSAGNSTAGTDYSIFDSENYDGLSDAQHPQYMQDPRQGPYIQDVNQAFALLATDILPEAAMLPQPSLVGLTGGYDGDYLSSHLLPLGGDALLSGQLVCSSMPFDQYRPISSTASEQASGAGPDMGLSWRNGMELPTSPTVDSHQAQQVLPSLPMTAPTLPFAHFTGLPLLPFTSFAPASLSPQNNEAGSSDGRTVSGSDSPDPGAPYRCQQCPGEYKTQGFLRKHIKRHEMRFKCPVCGNRYGAKKESNRHMWKYHPEEAQRLSIKKTNRACPAPDCDYNGRADDNLPRHILTHHPEHPEYRAQARRMTK